MKPSTNIVIADDHTIFRGGLRKLLEAERGFQVVGEASDGAEAVRLARQLKPDIILLDLSMPRYSGLEALRELESSGTPVRAILLVAGIEKDELIEALRAGARGVVLKESTTQLLIEAIRRVMAGQYWLGRESVSDLVLALREVQRRPGKSGRQTFGLTPRELEIVATIVSGCSNKDIAQQLHISEETVKHHLTNIFDKLGVSNRLELALLAVHFNLAHGPGADQIANRAA